MLLATFNVISADNRPDDIISIHSSPTRRLMVTFKPGETGCKKVVFFMDQQQVVRYVDDILQSLRMDVDPFENIQVTTRIHPAALFHVSDLDKCMTRHLILDMLDTAIDVSWM